MILLFEVMDKEPTLAVIWGGYLLLGGAGFFLGRVNPVFLVIILPVVFLCAGLNLSELNAPSIGADIVREAGYGYVIQNYIAMFLAAALPVAGVWAWFRRRKMSAL
jgi:hypothetical protein